MDTGDIIIIGASAAGISAAREIRSINGDIPVKIFSRERHYPYYRPLLTEYIGDETVQNKPNFYLNPEAWYREKNIDLLLGEEVARIDPASRTVITSHGTAHSYGKLVIACGSSPFVPIKGALEKSNVFSVRTLDDARAVYGYAGRVPRALVIGGGLLGLEAAHALARRGVRVTIIEVSERVLPRQLDAGCSLILQDIIARNDLTLLTGRTVESIAGGETATGVVLKGGEHVETDMIVFSIGVRPNTELARDCGVTIQRAAVVNDRMETSVPDVYACGDVAEHDGTHVALWMPAVRQGKTAGSNAAGRDVRYTGDIYPALLNSFGTKVFSAGDICLDRKEGEYRLHVVSDTARERYKKLFFVNDRLVGFILIGDISESQKLTAAVRNGSSFGELAI